MLWLWLRRQLEEKEELLHERRSRSRSRRSPNDRQPHHLEDGKDDKLEGDRGKGVEEGLDDDSGREVQEAEVGVHDGLDTDAEEGDLGGRGLGAGGLHLPDQEQHLQERDDGDHEGVVDGLGVVLLQAHVGGVDADHHAAVVAHEGPVHYDVCNRSLHILLALLRLLLRCPGQREPGPHLLVRQWQKVTQELRCAVLGS